MNFFKKNNAKNAFNYVEEQQGIINRFLRENGGWDSHLKNTQNYIVESIQNKPIKSIAILGSGWLLDVPMAFLLENLQKIYLVDIHHPPQIKHKYRKNKKIVFIETDITAGLISGFYETLKTVNKTKVKVELIPETISENNFGLTHKADFYVSVNLLNQLDILIVDYIEKFKIYNIAELENIRKIIQQQHIDFLPKGQSCLITDFEEINLNNENQIIDNKQLVYCEQPLKTHYKEWEWNFDFQKTYHTKCKTLFKVMAFNII